jgi:hypothetical protein
VDGGAIKAEKGRSRRLVCGRTEFSSRLGYFVFDELDSLLPARITTGQLVFVIGAGIVVIRIIRPSRFV